MKTPGELSAMRACGHQLTRVSKQVFAIGATLGNFSRVRAGSSAVERQSYTLLVGGSIPSLPTIGFPSLTESTGPAIDIVVLSRKITV